MDASFPTLDVLDVLTRAGSDRAHLGEHVGEQLDQLDALLVSDVLRAAGRVGDTLAIRRQLVQMCSILRALDAAERELIDAGELRTGLGAAAAASDRFAAFDSARIELRTLLELLERVPEPRLVGPLRAQVQLLHANLRGFVFEQLTGSSEGDLPRAVGALRSHALAPFSVGDESRAQAHHDLVEELLHGAAHHPVTGLLGAAWVRDWAAVPIVGEQLGEDDPGEIDRLASAITALTTRPSSLVLASVRRAPRWTIDGRALVPGNGLRSSWLLHADRRSLELVAETRSGWCVLTTPDLDFAVVEGAGHHALLGPRVFVDRACGVPAIEAVARFREHVEQLASHNGDEPPDDLVALAESYGRLRRRSR